jgi:hypothetical protein
MVVFVWGRVVRRGGKIPKTIPSNSRDATDTQFEAIWWSLLYPYYLQLAADRFGTERCSRHFQAHSLTRVVCVDSSLQFMKLRTLLLLTGNLADMKLESGPRMVRFVINLHAIEGLGFCFLAPAAIAARVGRCFVGGRRGRAARHDKGERKRPQDARVAIELKHHEG